MHPRPIYHPVQKELQQVTTNLRELAKGEFSFLGELLTHVLASEGKRVRPALTVLASKFHPNDGALATRMATAVELLHIATLIHDDTVDDSSLRHGKATVSTRWGGKIAVLLGDYVFAASATFVCDTYNVRTIRRFSETIMELSSGELMEMVGAYDWSLTREQYWRRIYHKTASLFCTAAESGAILSGAPEALVQALRTYGYNIGMAFQVVDDILDFQGTPEEVGKPVGNDLLQGTVTLPALILLERYPHDNPIVELFQQPRSNGSDRAEANRHLKRAVEMVQNSAIIQDAFAVAAEFCQKAQHSLDACTDNQYRRALVEMANYITERRT